MNLIRHFIQSVEQDPTTATWSVETVRDLVAYLESQPTIDWNDDEFYQLPRVLHNAANFLKSASENLLFEIEPLFALLPDSFNQSKGLLQNSFYTYFVQQVLQERPEISAPFLHHGMKTGRHLYTEGDNLSFVCQRDVFLSLSGTIIENSTTEQFSEFLDVIEHHHSPQTSETIYQILLYKCMNGARVELFDPLLSRMSLTSESKPGEHSITRSELLSFEWMSKAPNMFCELHNSVPQRPLCEAGGFDKRVWAMGDWMFARVNPENSDMVMSGISYLAYHLCLMNDGEYLEDIGALRTQDHPIFSLLWFHPDLKPFQYRIVEHLLFHVQIQELPFERGCEMAWIFFERLEAKTQVSPEMLRVLQQYPPYAKTQLELSVGPNATTRARKM